MVRLCSGYNGGHISSDTKSGVSSRAVIGDRDEVHWHGDHPPTKCGGGKRTVSIRELINGLMYLPMERPSFTCHRDR
jgi:hypothetical protein